MEKKFMQPDPEYRSAPFWSWNEELKVKYLKHQLDEMKKGGMAGGFMHSRIGLITPYLSKKWMGCVKDAVKYAKKIGIPIYLYDEDRWPSGIAGGIVIKNKKYAMNVLKATRLHSKKGSKFCKWEFETLTGGYLDTLKKDAVREFINSTHVAYRKVVGDEFNKTIPAIFTDEPNYMLDGWFEGFGFPWTDRLDEVFNQRYGYELKKNYISLVENIGDYKKVRYQFIRLATELFVENFGKQIYNWCKENNIALTGHYLAEDGLASQTKHLGAAMPLYEYMHMPGVDHLTRQLQAADIITILAIKQCSSVAHQLGKERMLSELFGCSGQNMTFTDRKWIGNWDTVLGVNFFCPHLWLYSLAGCRKRDYPPTISYQQPYWKYNRTIEDYFARINFITSQGRFYSDILIIHPIESAWCLYNPTGTKPVERLNNKFISLLEKLSGEHYDYDLGDESIISKWGRISVNSPSGKKGQGDVFFKVGWMGYRVVIIPPVISLRKTTVELLKSFLNSGGKVIGFRPIPERIDGKDDKNGLIRQLYLKVLLCHEPEKHLTLLLKSLIQKDIFISNNRDNEIEDIYYQHRVLNYNADIYFLVNNNKGRDYTVKVRIPAKNKTYMEIWDPITGNISLLNEVKREDGYLSASLYFPEAGSHILVRRNLTKSKRTGTQPYKISTIGLCGQGKGIARLFKSKWVCRQKNLNSLILDYCQYRTGGMNRWSKPTYVLDVQDILLKKLKNNASFSIRYSFKTKLNKRPDMFLLILERPEQYEIKVNKKRLNYKDSGYWMDIAFKKINIRDYILPEGKNTIELKGRFIHPIKHRTTTFVKNGTEIESVYLLGGFNVEGRFRPQKEGLIGQGFFIVDEKNPLATETVISGYPFYAGEFIFSQEFDFIPKGKRIFLSFDKLDAITLKVTLNKKEVGLLLWPPYYLEITDFLKKGKNLIEIEITNSLRNLLGPHHQRVVNPVGVFPGSFNDKKNWVDRYTFMPFGIGRGSIIQLKGESAYV